ncbi:MAG: Xaa-Pro peptidase family protein [Cellulosilyticaceae bacterium]
MNKRLEHLQNKLEELKIDAMLIGNGANRQYISGFTGSSAMLYISKKTAAIITDFRYIEQATNQCNGFEVVNQGTDGIIKTAMMLVKADNAKYIGFESAHTNYSTFKQLSEYTEFTFVPTENIVEAFRQIKDESELAKLRKAESIGDLAFAKIISLIQSEYKKGLTENDVALELERTMRQNGASGTSFNSIVAAGAKSSLCHAVPGNETLQAGGFVVMDFGCIYEGYCSDMTRTIFVGEPTAKHHEIYNAVLKAQLAALKAIKPGMMGREVDKVARDIITEAGYGEYFGHGLGHSAGLEIHENPRFSMAEEQIIRPGMVVTVEPGIYVPGFGGVRIEDMIVVTETGIENFTKSPKELIIVE